MSDSLRPHGLLCPWDSQGKNTGVRCHSLFQGIFPTQRSNPVSCIAGRFFTIWATREAPKKTQSIQNYKDSLVHLISNFTEVPYTAASSDCSRPTLESECQACLNLFLASIWPSPGKGKRVILNICKEGPVELPIQVQSFINLLTYLCTQITSQCVT